MSLLIPVTELTNRQGLNSSPIPKLYGVPSIVKVRERGSSSAIIMDGKKVNEERTVSEDYTTIKALVNDGIQDFIISLNETNGKKVLLKASKIVEVYENTVGNSIVRYRGSERAEDIFYIVTETMDDMRGLIPTSPQYKSYISRLTQTGTSAPTEVVIKDEIGMGAWSRFATGFYGNIPLTPLVSDKTAVFGSINFADNISDDMYSVFMYEAVGFVAVNTGLMQSGGSGNPVDRVLEDGRLTNTVIEIRSYN